MSDEEPANKRRRTHSAAAALDISDLPDAVLRHCLTFVGKGYFRLIAGTNRQFREAYSITRDDEEGTGFGRKTTWKEAALSVSCAELCFEDWKENTEEEKRNALEKLSLEASGMGRIDVLEWARSKGFEFTPRVFEVAAKHGHVCVIKWAKELYLDWFSEFVLLYAARNGHVSIFEFAHSARRDIPRNCRPVHHAAVCHEQFGVLKWLKGHNLTYNPGYSIWLSAVMCGSIRLGSSKWVPAR